MYIMHSQREGLHTIVVPGHRNEQSLYSLGGIRFVDAPKAAFTLADFYGVSHSPSGALDVGWCSAGKP